MLICDALKNDKKVIEQKSGTSINFSHLFPKILEQSKIIFTEVESVNLFTVE